METGIISQHGGYRNLLTYQKSKVIYDGTVYFCQKNFGKYDRTAEQMTQAARSGKQNIVEASMASGTSKKTELKLTNVARASLEELLKDYEDFLRIRKIEKWNREHPFSKRFSEINRSSDQTYENFQKGIEHSDPGISANFMICLINVTTYLLYRQIKSLEEAFLKDGGFTEKMYRTRKNNRKK